MIEEISEWVEQIGSKRTTNLKKKNVVVYNLPESEEEQAKDRYKEGEEACKKCLKTN